MAGEMTEFFNQLIFGSGAWIGLLIFLVLIGGLVLKWKAMGLLMVPMSVFLGLEYLTNNLGWHAIIMLLESVFLIIYLSKEYYHGG